MRSHTPANPQRQMIRAWKRPDVALELWQKLDNDLLGSLRHEIALGHLQLVRLQSPRLRKQLVPRSPGQHHKIGGAPFALQRIARLLRIGVNALDALLVNLATGLLCAIQQQSIQDSARIDDDRLLELKSCTLILRADDLDFAN